MSQNRILVDSNAYFRLAQSIHPLLNVEFGDEEMRIAAGAYDIKIFKTLELLKLMLDCRHIDIKKIREIAAYWIYLNDKPKDFHLDYKRLFGEMPPK
jgi:hypothetical protein